jgi:glutamyl-tRNA reductase
MNLLSVCINHHTAPVEIRESLFLHEDEIRDFIKVIKIKYLKEGLIISTCNRTELYGLPENPNINSLDIQNFLLQYKSKNDLKPEFFHHFISKPLLNIYLMLQRE